MLRLNEVRRDRIASASGVAAVHALLLFALLRGLGFDVTTSVSEQLKMFDVLEEPPPPSEPPPPEKVRESKEPKPKDPEGAASPANLKDTPTQIVVPPPEIKLPPPPPIPAAPIAGRGNAPAAGAAEVPGPGTGRGGQGTGLGSGNQGSGTGGGGGGFGRASRARLISGSLGPEDYPPSAFEARVTGTVGLRFVVTPNGRVSDCTVSRSSGSAALDSTTCRLITRRLRYRPARNAEGRPIAEVIRGQHEWVIGPDRPANEVEELPEE